MNEERRSLDLVCIFQRRVEPKSVNIIPCSCTAILIFGKIISDISCVRHGYPVGYGSLRCGCLETVSMPDDPVGHESTITATGDTHSRRVNLREGIYRCIGESHQVIVVDCAILATDVAEFVSTSITTTRIAEYYKIPLGCPDLHFMKENLTICTFGATMNI